MSKPTAPSLTPPQVPHHRTPSRIRRRSVVSARPSSGPPVGDRLPAAADPVRQTGFPVARCLRDRCDCGHHLRIDLSAGHRLDHRRPDRPPPAVRAVGAGAGPAGSGRGRGGPVLGPPGAGGPADHAGRGQHAGRPVRATAEAAGVVPRPVAGRAADVPGRVRSVDRPAFPLLRAGLPGGERGHLRDRRRDPAVPVGTARAHRGCAGHSVGAALVLVRVALSDPGPCDPRIRSGTWPPSSRSRSSASGSSKRSAGLLTSASCSCGRPATCGTPSSRRRGSSRCSGP